MFYAPPRVKFFPEWCEGLTRLLENCAFEQFSARFRTSFALSKFECMYRCVATTVEGFIQQLAVCYLRDGYFFYVSGIIPLRKNPEETDRKLIERYQIHLSKYARTRRKKRGLANIQYLRYGHFFVLLATKGEHDFFRMESLVKDIRREPLRFGGYSIGYRMEKGNQKWHPSVRIEKRWAKKIRNHFERMATWASEEDLVQYLKDLPFEPFAPVRRQIFAIAHAINLKRKIANLPQIPLENLLPRRASVKPFA